MFIFSFPNEEATTTKTTSTTTLIPIFPIHLTTTKYVQTTFQLSSSTRTTVQHQSQYSTKKHPSCQAPVQDHSSQSQYRSEVEAEEN